MQRGKQPNLGQWTAPGGKLETDEAPPECARRELLEETGIQIKDGDQLVLRAIISETGPQNWLMFVYLVELDQQQPQPPLIECKEGRLAWVEMSQVMRLNIPAGDTIFYPRIIQSSSPVYEVKFVYDQNEKLIETYNFS
jgi:8-oxo-dGTP diphosphatase